jgi:hypothetical protein
MGTDFILTLFTNDPELARRADGAGIDRVGLDLEKIGKGERQDARRCWISDHKAHEIHAVRRSLRKAKLFARTNPIHPGSRGEIAGLLGAGVEVLMLPMFTTVAEAARFIDLVDRRATVSLLLETAAAAARADALVKLEGVDEIHVGLNDLHLSLGLDSHFELLTSSLMDWLSQTVRDAGIPFGFGGVGRHGDERLPIPADLVYAQYPRLGADRALVSRVFVSPDYRTLDLAAEVALFRSRISHWCGAPPEALSEVRGDLRARAARLSAARAANGPASAA